MGLNGWVIADDSGIVRVLNLPATNLHLWIDQVGFAAQSVEVSAEGIRYEALRVWLKTRRDSRSSPDCAHGAITASHMGHNPKLRISAASKDSRTVPFPTQIPRHSPTNARHEGCAVGEC
jgi:hypothetical protein